MQKFEKKLLKYNEANKFMSRIKTKISRKKTLLTFTSDLVKRANKSNQQKSCENESRKSENYFQFSKSSTQ